ncbi:uncharacterized protein LOC113239454 [Hyposmocoma kahamanoa]|uniref:uncharacterized protein LOC113239454 n=1 Tax=Hyposmocoma kahamanoa TaxID=1477025 RepID=UPI000E6D93EB|nr:uncharacterized protein LOC113239454 [Hyposmocoma kahamanoa]
MSSMVGTLGLFDYRSQEWQIFRSRLELFLKVNKEVLKGNEAAVLLTHLSDDTYRLVRNLVHPRKLEDLKFEQLIEALQAHFTPKRSTFADRAKFYEATKFDGESAEDWAARLRGLAVHCEFGAELETLLRDRFVLGFKTGPERDRLCEQEIKNLTLAKALEVAQQAACARQARAAILDVARVKDEPVYKVEGWRGQGAPAAAARAGPAAAEIKCTVCGLRNHVASKCRYKNYKCQICGQKGHLKKKVCCKKSRVHNIEVQSESDHECEECKLFNVSFHECDGEVLKLLNEYPHIWKNDLGTFNKFEVELTLKENAQPKFCKSRVVPFALKDKVTEELNRLVGLGILVPVKFSEYATPIVPVLKENGKISVFFFQDSVTYLGYVIDKNGLRTCPKKVEAIVCAPVPQNVTEVKRFLGVVNYYRNFIPNASGLLLPLHELLRSEAAWEWGARQQQALEAVKRELSGARVLAHFDPQAPLVLTVDASPAGLGAVLAHADADGRERPIAFASRSLTVSERNYSQIQKEATAIVFGVKRFHQYLYGRQDPFVLKTDHRPLLSIFGKKNGISVTAALRLQRYAVILSAYNYTVQYINSKNNAVADYFSRAPLTASSNECERDSGKYFLFLDANIQPVSFSDIIEATARDSVLQTVIKYMNRGWPRKIKCKDIQPYYHCKSDLEFNSGCLFRGHRIVIPKEFRARMLQELHSAHFGVVKTKSTARCRMWWAGIDADIERWIGACEECARLRPAPARAPPAPWPRPPGPWLRIHIDYMSVGQNVYLVVVDAFSKWLECIPMNHGTSTSALIVKLKYLFSRFGLPKTIVSDNDIKICAKEFHTFCNNNGIKNVTSPIYHPASNGQAENSVKTCKKMLKCILNNRVTQKAINEELWGFLFEYRNTVHCTTNETPAKQFFGRNLRSRLDLVLPTTRMSDSVIEQENHKACKSFQVGDIVWAKYFISRESKWRLAKIVKLIGTRMYELQFKDSDKLCRRHIDQIRKHTSKDMSGGTEATDNDSTPKNLSSPLAIPPLVTSPVVAAPPFTMPSSPASFSPVLTTPNNFSPGSNTAAVLDQSREVEERTLEAENEGGEDFMDCCADPVVMESQEPIRDSGGETARPSERVLRPRKKIDYKSYF